MVWQLKLVSPPVLHTLLLHTSPELLQSIEVAQGPFITPNYSFCLRASRSVWEKFWQPLPPRGYTDIFALVKQKLMQVEGDLHPFMANLLYFKDVIAAPRREGKR